MKNNFLNNFLKILTIVLLAVAVNPLLVHAAQSGTDGSSEWKLVALTQRAGEYNIDVKVRLPKEEVSSIKTFMLQFRIAGEVPQPTFVFSGAISDNKEITVREFTYAYDETKKEGVFSVYVSGRVSVFGKSNEFVDLGRMELLNGSEYGSSSVPGIEVSVLDYQIVNTFRQESVNLDYEDACDMLTLSSSDVGSELNKVLEEAEAYVGSGSGLDGKLFTKISRYTNLTDAYERAKAVDRGNQTAMDQAAKQLSEAIEGVRPIYGLLHILTEANVAIEGYGRVDCGELLRRFNEALEYLEKNGNPDLTEIGNKSRLLKFEIVVSNVRISVVKSQLSKEEEGKYTEGNLTAWRNALNSAVFLLGRRDTTELEDIVDLTDDAAKAASDLNAAYAGLVDVTGLRELVKRAEAMIAEEGKYTENSVQNLKAARERAAAFLQLKTVITLDGTYNEKGELVQEGYHAMYAALNDAVSKIQERVETSETRQPDPEESPEGNESNPGGSSGQAAPSTGTEGTGTSGSVTPSGTEGTGASGSTAPATGTEGSGSSGSATPSETQEVDFPYSGQHDFEEDTESYDAYQSDLQFFLILMVVVIVGILFITVFLICYRSRARRMRI